MASTRVTRFVAVLSLIAHLAMNFFDMILEIKLVHCFKRAQFALELCSILPTANFIMNSSDMGP